MSSPNQREFDMTPSPKGKAGEAFYRVQRIDWSWSEWRKIEEPIKEEHVLSIQVSEYITPEQYKTFMAQIKWSQ